MTKLWARRCGVRIPVVTRNFSLHQCVQKGCEANLGILFCGYQGFFWVEKRPEREADHSSSCVEVRNEWSCTSAPPCSFMVWKGTTLPLYYSFVGRDSSVGMVTRFGLDGPGIESRWRSEILRTRPDRTWGPPSPMYNGYRVSLPRVKRLGRGVDHPPPSSAEVKG